MKKIIYTFAAFAALISISCEENFTPKGIFNERYVLNCIISADSTRHFAILMKTYDVEGFNPELNNIDPIVRNAEIRLKWRNNWYTFRDTIIQRPDTTRYGSDLYAYFLDGIRPESFDSVEIYANPEQGVELTARTRVPSAVTFTRSATTIRGGEDFTISWTPHVSGVWYLPRLKIVYTKASENNQIEHFVETPTSLFLINGVYTPFYPGFSPRTNLRFEEMSLDSTIIGIAGDLPKNSFKIVRAEFELLLFDQFLSNYISVSNGYFDNLSIRTDENNYTNIRGGFGVFGTYKKMSLRMIINPDYVRSLGYIP